MPLLATGLGVVAIVLSLSMAVPQAIVIWRDRSTVGVSVATFVLFSLTFSAWVGYSLRSGNQVVLAANVLSITTAALLLLGTLRAEGWPRPRSIVAPLVLLSAWVVLAVHGNQAPVAAVAPVLLAGSLVRVPQIVASARSAAAGSATDVSLPTWWVSFASGWFWFGHAVLVGDVLVAISAVVIVLTSGAVLALEHVVVGRASATADSIQG